MEHVFAHSRNFKPTCLNPLRSISDTANDLRYIHDAWAYFMESWHHEELDFQEACTRKIVMIKSCLAYHGWNECTWWEAEAAMVRVSDLYRLEAYFYRGK